jgi:hypothetical protein
VTKRRIKGFEALPSAGIYERQRPVPLSPPLTERQVQDRLRRQNSFASPAQLGKFCADLERMAKAVLRQFIEQEGLPELDPGMEMHFRGRAHEKKRHLVEKRIEEIRAEAAKPNETEVIKMRKRLAAAEAAADALELQMHARFVPKRLNNIAEQSQAIAWIILKEAFEMGQAYERIRIRPIEAYARTAIVRVKKTTAFNQKRMAPKGEERLRAYAEEHRRQPNASHWTICQSLAPRFAGNSGRPLTPKAFSNSIPRSLRVVIPRP